MTVIDFNSKKPKKDAADKRAEELIEFVRSNAEDNEEMREFLSDPNLKNDVLKIMLETEEMFNDS